MRAIIAIFMSLLALVFGEMPKTMHKNALFRSQTQSSVSINIQGSSESLSTPFLANIVSLRGGNSDSVKELTSIFDLEEIITNSSDKLIIIDFTGNVIPCYLRFWPNYYFFVLLATWCGPCKMISPIFHSLADSGAYPNAIFIKVIYISTPFSSDSINALSIG